MAPTTTQRFHGRNGRLYVGIANAAAAASPVAYVKQFTMDMTTDKPDVTAFGDTNKKQVVGLPNGAGTINGFADLAGDALYTAARDGIARKWYFYPDTVNSAGTYFFSAGNFDLSFDFSVDAGASFTGNWSATEDISRVLQS